MSSSQTTGMMARTGCARTKHPTSTSCHVVFAFHYVTAIFGWHRSSARPNVILLLDIPNHEPESTIHRPEDQEEGDRATAIISWCVCVTASGGNIACRYSRSFRPHSKLTITVIEEPGRARKRRDVKQRGVFKLADTVPGTWEGSGHEADKLKVCFWQPAQLTTGKNPGVDAGASCRTSIR